VVCMINAPGIDLLIPLIPPDLNTDPDEHGTDIRIFSIQVKCRLVSEQRADAAVHEKMGRSYAFSGSDLSEGEDPYVTLYLQVGAPTSSKPEWVLTHDTSQISFEIFGLDEIHFLTHQESRELKETLSSIARAWLDPLKLPQPSWISSDLKTRLVRWTRSMMPLIYTDKKVEDIVSTPEPFPVGYNGNAVHSFLRSTLQSMNYSSLPQHIDLWHIRLNFESKQPGSASPGAKRPRTDASSPSPSPSSSSSSSSSSERMRRVLAYAASLSATSSAVSSASSSTQSASSASYQDTSSGAGAGDSMQE